MRLPVGIACVPARRVHSDRIRTDQSAQRFLKGGDGLWTRLHFPALAQMVEHGLALAEHCASLLAQTHRVYALDLRGFGDSANDDAGWEEQLAADDLHHLVDHLGAEPVHLLVQDISGGVGFRFASTHPHDVLSFTAIESTLAGFGLEMLADVNGFGSWHVGFLGAPHIPSLLLPGRERTLLAEWAYPMMNGTEGAVTAADLDEFIRTYSRANGWRGTESRYRALFTDNGATKVLAETHPIAVPVLAIDGVNILFTATSFRQVSSGEFSSVHIEGTGHLVAQEAPEALAAAVLDFTTGVDRN